MFRKSEADRSMMEDGRKVDMYFRPSSKRSGLPSSIGSSFWRWWWITGGKECAGRFASG